MQVWIDRRKPWARLMSANPDTDKDARVLASDLNGFECVRGIVGTYHGCRVGKIKAVDITVSVPNVEVRRGHE